MCITAQEEFDEVIRVLVEFGADVNVQDNEGSTPVLAAAENNNNNNGKARKRFFERSKFV